MNIFQVSELLGNFGEFFGALLLFASLVYVGVQVRQNTNLASGTAQREVMASFQLNLDRIRTNPQLVQKGLAQFDSLSHAEQLEFTMIINQFVNHLEQPLRMLNRGLETQDTVDVYGDICMAILQEPGGLELWERTKPLFFPLARQYVEERFKNPGTLPPPISKELPWWGV